MTDIIEKNEYPPAIRLIDIGEPVQGGPTGVDNRAPIQLANRTAWLKSKLEDLIVEITEVDGRVGAALEEVAAQLAGAMTYSSTTLGLDGTVDGGYFSVPSTVPEEYLILYKNNAGVATEIKRYPSSEVITNLGFGTMDAETNEMSFALGDQAGFSSWVQVDRKGLPTRYTISCIGEKLSITDVPILAEQIANEAAKEVGFGEFDADLNEVSFSLADSVNTRSDIELNLKGQFTDRVIKSIGLRLGAISSEAVIPPFPLDAWACWGDSLTAGGWPTTLGTLSGLPVYNGGWGGQGYSQIAARQGGVPARLTVTGGAIPSTGGVAVTAFINNPLSEGGSRQGVLGGVTGTLSMSGGTLTFTRGTAGAGVVCPPRSYFTPTDGALYADRHVTIWTGRNSFKDVTPASIVTSIRSMIDYLTPRVKRVIVMSIPPWVGEEFGTGNRVKLDACNAAIQTAFPEFWLDIAAWVRTEEAAVAAGVTLNADDQTDITNGLTPRSLRSDSGHLNAAGNVAVGKRVYQESQIKGWMS